MILILFVFGILSFLLGLVLSFTTYKCQFKKDPIVEIVNNLLPQTQCAQCGYSGCYPYAEAIVHNSETIDKCTPGGLDLVLKISHLLKIKIPKNTIINDKKKENTTVWIDEKNCVGCSKCVIFCPVDAIIGAPNLMHTVLQEYCTGCNICLLHCPTNCMSIRIKNYE